MFFLKVINPISKVQKSQLKNIKIMQKKGIFLTRFNLGKWVK